jgi:N-acetylmuramoyl-L-alanine amidase
MQEKIARLWPANPGSCLMPIDHTIEEGESTISLALQYGFFVNTIWDYPANADLKRKRKDMNVLMPGDIVVIPDKEIKEVSGATEQLHRFKRKGIPAIYRLQVFDCEKPRANQAYRLSLDGQVLRGTTDANGILQQPVPPDATEGELIIGPDEFRLTIDFGHLDPITEISGVQKRLNNLGYLCGEADGELDEPTRDALADFQDRFGLEPTGELDDATLKKLEEVHDAPNQFPNQPQPAAGGGN